MQLKIKTPAKINLSLDVLGTRADGYHDIASIMQTISLYDYLTFELKPSESLIIELNGSNPNIPYNEKNLIYKAITLFYKEVQGLKNYHFKIFVEKNIPTEAGLGGGSANAAGTIWALNKLLNTQLTNKKIDSLCAKLGSDLNVCYWGGTSLATARGEKVQKLPTNVYPLCIIKPNDFGISAKQGYEMFDALKTIKNKVATEGLLQALNENRNIEPFLHNDLEIAPLKEFEQLKEIKTTYPYSIMTGSGSAYFILKEKLDKILPSDRFLTIQGLTFTKNGIEEV